MIILTSNGLSSEALIEKMQTVVKGKTKAVIVTTASVGFKEKDWHIPRLKSELVQLGLSVEFFDFDSENPKKLLQYDVIEINGGNPFYLLNAMKQSSCDFVMRELARSKIIIGVSAGAIILQKNIELIAQYNPEMNNDIGLANLTGLSLTSLEILPHYNRFIDKFDLFEERAEKYERENNCKVIRINDGEAVFDYGESYV